MSTYTELFYHFVWATRQRQSLITPLLEERLYDHIRRKCEELGAYVYALSGMPDHVHLVCSLPTKLSIAEFLQEIKGSSAHFINRLPDVQANLQTCLYWQPGYGALTFTKNELARIIAYVDNQKTHHETRRLSDKMERTQPASAGFV